MVRTLLPVATELVGSRPAYEGYFPLWCCVSFAAVKILGATYVQAPLFNGSSYSGMNGGPRRGHWDRHTWHHRISAFGYLSRWEVILIMTVSGGN